MSPDEARSLLEVGPDASADEVRRAYTRLIKKYKPDAQPEMFRRVREAYEVVRTSAEARDAIAAIAAPASPAAPGDAPLAGDPMTQARQALSRRLADARGHAVQLMREHLTAFPADDRVRLAAIIELDVEGDVQAAAALARVGADEGTDRSMFLQRLALLMPSAVREDEIEVLRGEPATAPAAVIALTAAGKLEPAQTVAFDALAASTGLTDLAAAQARARWLEAVAFMYEQDAGPLARALMREIDRCLPDDARHGEEGARVLALLLRELGDVAGELDRPITAALGTFLRRPVLGAVRVDEAFAQSTRSEQNAKLLHGRAPTLGRLVVARMQASGGSTPRTTVRGTLGAAGTMLFLLFMFVLRGCLFRVVHETMEATSRPTHRGAPP